MNRKPPKRASDSTPAPLTTERVAELAVIIADPYYAVGPQDEADLIEALRELVERRNAEKLIQSMTVEEDRSAA